MAKADLLNILYSKDKSPLEFKFDSLWMPSILNYLTIQDINQLHDIASSVRLSSKIELKYKMIDEIMVRRGFRKFHCGTNRIVYSFLEDQSFLMKIALDRVGLRDNPDEFRNQELLKPFVTKMFECTPCGTVATVERVEPITSREEFMSVADDVFNLLSECIIGKYVLEDIGTKYFMNYGLRKGFGVCLLDYPYVYEIDSKKLYCNKQDNITHQFCKGEIDYDSGFNNLVCTKCGKKYLATELKTFVENKNIIIRDEGEIDMQIKILRGNEVIKEINTDSETDTYVKKVKKSNRERNNELEVRAIIPGKSVGNSPRISEKEKPLNPNRYKEMADYTKNHPYDHNNPCKEEIINEVVEKEEPKIESVRKSIDIDLPLSSTFIPEQDEEDNGEVITSINELENDALSSINLSDKDFEEPKEDNSEIVKKYEDEYSDNEYENFEKIGKKGSNSKFMSDNY